MKFPFIERSFALSPYSRKYLDSIKVWESLRETSVKPPEVSREQKLEAAGNALVQAMNREGRG